MREIFESTIERLLADTVTPQQLRSCEGGEWPEALWSALTEQNVSWNRPHKLDASLDVRFDDEAPAAFGWLKHTGLNLFVEGQSGRPYTPENSHGDASGAPNSKNALFQMTTDMRVNRAFGLGVRRVDLSLAGTNIFGNHLISRVDPQTGRGRVWGTGSYDPTNPFLNVDEYTRISVVNDPSNYGPGAQWRLSLDYDF